MRFEFELKESSIREVLQHVVLAGPDSTELRADIESGIRRTRWVVRCVAIGITIGWGSAIALVDSTWPAWMAWSLLISTLLLVGAIGCEFQFARDIKNYKEEILRYAHGLYHAMGWDQTLGRIQIDLDEQGLTITEETKSVTYFASAIADIDRIPSAIVVYVDQSNLIPIIIRDLGRTDTDEFCEQLTSWSGKEIRIIPA